MNKQEFIKSLSEKLDYEIETCEEINQILEENFFLSKKNKDKIVSTLSDRLNVSINEAKYIYEVSIEVLKEALKNKIKHPFRSLD